MSCIRMVINEEKNNVNNNNVVNTHTTNDTTVHIMNNSIVIKISSIDIINIIIVTEWISK